MYQFNTQTSQRYFEEALRVIPGGVNSPVRAFQAVGGQPLFIRNARGAFLMDVDGNRLIDYVGSFGPLILGHSCPEVTEAIAKAAQNGTTYGAPCWAEVRLAEMICEAIPAVEKVRMVNSGTEATMSAVRLARAFTGRDKIVKFEGCYHGHGDCFLVKAGSGMLTERIPSSPGVPQSILEHTLIAQYNDLASVEALFANYPQQIAAVIVEPVPANMGLVLPQPGFLEGLRRLTEASGALLIFDEVITGFRTCYGGYQNRVGIQPDLTTLGKIIGGGLPVGAYGGRRDIMDMVAPAGKVYQAGTLSGNPLAMAAGRVMLELLKANPLLYSRLEEETTAFAARIQQAAAALQIPMVVNHFASMLTLFFTALPQVNSYHDVATADTERFKYFHQQLLKGGVYFPPSQFEVAFLSAAHSEDNLNATFHVIQTALEGFQNHFPV